MAIQANETKTVETPIDVTTTAATPGIIVEIVITTIDTGTIIIEIKTITETIIEEAIVRVITIIDATMADPIIEMNRRITVNRVTEIVSIAASQGTLRKIVQSV